MGKLRDLHSVQWLSHTFDEDKKYPCYAALQEQSALMEMVNASVQYALYTMHNAQCTMHNALCTMHCKHRVVEPVPTTTRLKLPQQK